MPIIVRYYVYRKCKRNPPQGTNCTGRTGIFGNFANAQGIWFAQVVISLILRVKDIWIFPTKNKIQICLTLDKSVKSVSCMK